MVGYYKCEKCNILIDVVSVSRNPHTYLSKVKIPTCPVCGGNVQEIDLEDYLKIDKYKGIFRLKRVFRFKHVGSRVIDMRIKFLKDKDNDIMSKQ